MTRWVFVRHAESVANANGWLAGQLDAPLTTRGRAQAAALAARVDLRGVERVFSSDLVRAVDTARQLVGPERHVEITRAIRERDLGEWEGRARSVLRASGELDRLLSWHDAPPRGESLADCARRMLSFLAAHDSELPTLVVTHGAVMRATLGTLDGRPESDIGTWGIGNATAHERRVATGTWTRLLQQLGV